MPAASLVGRSELLAWLNRTLGTDYLRLEECADCVGYAQLLEAVHPGTVPLHRLHFEARRGAERQHNAKILNAALHRANIAWPHDVPGVGLGLGLGLGLASSHRCSALRLGLGLASSPRCARRWRSPTAASSTTTSSCSGW